MLTSCHKGILLGFDYKSILNEEHYKIQDFIEFTIDKLGLTKSMFSLLKFTFIDHPEDHGHFDYRTDEGHSIINNLSDLHIIRTIIAHELIHAQQWASGRLRYSFERCGKTFKQFFVWDDKRVDHIGLDYCELPWEIDAHSRQYDITSQYTVENFVR